MAVAQVAADLHAELALVRVGDRVLRAGRGVADLQRPPELRAHGAQGRGHQADRRHDADRLAVAVAEVHEGRLRLRQAVDPQDRVRAGQVVLRAAAVKNAALLRNVAQKTSLIFRPEPRPSLRGTVVMAPRSSLMMSRRSTDSIRP